MLERGQQRGRTVAVPGDRSRWQQRLVFIAVSIAFVALSCTTDSFQPTASSDLPPVAAATPTPVAAPAVATAEPTMPPPTATPIPTIIPAPTITPVAELPHANPIGDLVAAPPGTYVIAKPDAGLLLDNGARIVSVYDVPDGQPRILVDRNEIDNVWLDYPLVNPTVFGQLLVLRVVAGDPTDDWVLVQAPVRPHRQYVWVRASDFSFGQSSMRIEVDLGRKGRFALFDGENELITNPAVYGREGRATVLHDTYVEQVFAGSVLSPAYGDYILTIASYSNDLGTYGGGGMPGQSIHGTNQPELVGQRVSSGGIRLPNEIIEFVYAQADILGASVVIYDSSGIGRDAAIAQQRNKPWTRAETTELIPQDLPAAAIPSYS